MTLQEPISRFANINGWGLEEATSPDSRKTMTVDQLTVPLAVATGLVGAIGLAASQIIREINQGRTKSPTYVIVQVPQLPGKKTRTASALKASKPKLIEHKTLKGIREEMGVANEERPLGTAE